MNIAKVMVVDSIQHQINQNVVLIENVEITYTWGNSNTTLYIIKRNQDN